MNFYMFILVFVVLLVISFLLTFFRESFKILGEIILFFLLLYVGLTILKGDIIIFNLPRII